MNSTYQCISFDADNLQNWFQLVPTSCIWLPLEKLKPSFITHSVSSGIPFRGSRCTNSKDWTFTPAVLSVALSVVFPMKEYMWRIYMKCHKKLHKKPVQFAGTFIGTHRTQIVTPFIGKSLWIFSRKTALSTSLSLTSRLAPVLSFCG